MQAVSDDKMAGGRKKSLVVKTRRKNAHQPPNQTRAGDFSLIPRILNELFFHIMWVTWVSSVLRPEYYLFMSGDFIQKSLLWRQNGLNHWFFLPPFSSLMPWVAIMGIVSQFDKPGTPWSTTFNSGIQTGNDNHEQKRRRRERVLSPNMAHLTLFLMYHIRTARGLATLEKTRLFSWT